MEDASAAAVPTVSRMATGIDKAGGLGRPFRTALAGMACALCGCAHSYIDEQGNTHVIGVAHVMVPAVRDTGIGAQSIRVRSLGLSLLASGSHTNLTLGWNDDTLLFVRNHACVPAAIHFPRTGP